LEPTYLAKHTMNWRDVVIKALNIQVTLKKGISYLAERLLAFQERIRSVKTFPLYGTFNG